MLDFTSVSGFDFSAVNILARFLESANAAGVHVVLSAAPEQPSTGLNRTLPPSGLAHVLLEPNADRALERCEEIVLAAWRADASEADERR